ncbi:MAG: EAL domain-containing protein [Proteobacteria bacterium]|nr:EAL domain-containing protein [Pseudomonadota bacterium]
MFSTRLAHKEVMGIALKIACIVLCVEAFIMFVLLPIIDPHMGQVAEGLIDTVSLVIISTPLIINFVLRPYVLGLQKALDSLEKGEKTIIQTAKRLRLTKERYALASKGVNDGLWDWDLQKDKLYLASRWKEIMGWKAKNHKPTIGQWIKLIHPDDRERFQRALQESQAQKNQTRHTLEFRVARDSGDITWVEMRWICMCYGDKATRLIGSIMDVTQKKNLESELSHGALHDSLTRLPNRVLLNERLSQALANYKRDPKRKFALLFIDLDNFKRVNDTLGHSAGDELLVHLSKRLVSCVRDTDTVARLGGDEFAILLLGTHTKSHINGVMERIGKAMETPIKVHNHEIYAGLSMGVVVSSKAHIGVSHEKLLSDADMALYRAKHEGKGRFAVFDVEMREKQKKIFDISNSLIGALERREMTLFYQPIMDMKSNQVAGFEALMRWRHPVYGGLSPDVFIPLAEESELIHKLGAFALEEALSQLYAWNETFGHKKWHMCVNVSNKQLLHPNFYALLENAITKGNVAPTQVVLEITESIISKYCDNTDNLLRKIKAMGIRLSIDDFGTGNSSLSTFRQYPFDVLKIDKSFVGEKVERQQIEAFIKAIQTLAKVTSVKTVAEGIETPEQYAFLKKMGCDFGQGYLFEKPLPANQIEVMLKEGLFDQKVIVGQDQKSA